MLYSSLCIGFIVIVLKTKPQEESTYKKLTKNKITEKKTLGSCNGDLFVDEKMVQPPAMVAL